ncbi:probable transmembrane GTPase FZO-like, chloroplastic [Phoenix dactylifera]|uniref:Probable transmembrane GTPase FZO-like, chloroplastic n=1 Tax=Phoenix dactylifera TaxID=42345 RepID=A0A8B7BQE4_PHODC|nr:probable transmembrane GTPase FZO-like, chloroplastic [Phoenix dactylifera]
MVSIPCNYTVAARRPKFPLLPKRHVWNTFPRAPPSRCRVLRHPINVIGASSASFDPSEQQQRQLRTLFPGGFKRPEIKVPTLVLRLRAEEVLRREGSIAEIDVAVAKGVGMVVLDCGDESGGGLYEAACRLKSVIGDRAYFLIAERVDIAAAVGASGVVLSDKGIPAIVARNMMMQSKPDSVYLPLVARTVQTANSAISASSFEGADFLIMSMENDNYVTILENSVNQQVKVPVFFAAIELLHDELPFNMASKLLQLGACGIVITLGDMKLSSDDILKAFSKEDVVSRVSQDVYANSSRMDVEGGSVIINGRNRVAGFMKLGDREIKLIEAERMLLHEAVAVVKKAAPMMKEVSLLEDAASRLSEPFLLVVVGEFNSGKSTVINALLGKRYLKEGVVPTTNEIALLSHSDMESNQQDHCERHPDGQLICYLNAPILKEMNLVDTPGTNVILQRQQRLTEEFVPRADLVLFVISSDRPLTESEVAFLLYVQQWKKKVVFVLNKLDLYRNASELEEATTFVKENVQKLLNIEDVKLFPVAARSALEAKLSSVYDGRNSEEVLLNDPGWMSSRFYELENFLFSFLDGSTDTGMERVRLKLETPIGIADRLLTSCDRLMKKEYENASEDLISIKEVVSSVKEYAVKMEGESISWKKQIISLIETAKAQVLKLLESTLRLSNIDLISTYAFKGETSSSVPATLAVQNEIISPALSDAQRLLWDYSKWLQSKIADEGKLYMECFNKQCQALGNVKGMGLSEPYGLLVNEEELCMKVIEKFNASTAARLIEKEVREVVLGTFGGLGAAGLSASLLTSVLPTTVEDLIALSFCSAGGWLAISKFPARRKDAIEKVRRVADSLTREIEDAMQKDLQHSTEKLTHFVEIISKPYQEAAQHRMDRLLMTQGELTHVAQKLQALKVEIQNLHVS